MDHERRGAEPGHRAITRTYREDPEARAEAVACPPSSRDQSGKVSCISNPTPSK